MFDAASIAVKDRADQFDQRRAGLDPQRTGNIRRGKAGGNPLGRAFDLDARPFQVLKQRPVGQLVAAERNPDTLRHMRQQIGKPQAVDRADADDRCSNSWSFAPSASAAGR